MHALLVTVSIDPANSDQARQELETRVVPAVKQAPGLVAAYWVAPKPDGDRLQGFSVALFDSEANAQQAEQMAKTSPLAPGVAFTSFEIGEVIAQT
jgi:hypothetical protein